MPSTYFTAPPQWHWLIILYFFVGGIAGGSYFLAVLFDLFGRITDRPLGRLGYLIAFPLVVLCGLLLTVDLGRPERFWHMLIQSGTWRPMLKAYSPMSVGAWGLLGFGFFSFLSFLGAIGDAERSRWPRLRVLRPPRMLGALVAIVGAFFALFISGYTGVLLAVTNRPIWSDTPLLGLTFLVSSASTSAALLTLLGWRRRWAATGLHALANFDRLVLVFEFIALIALIVSLGSIAQVWLNAWGALLVLGVMVAGILIPLALHSRARVLSGVAVPVAAVLILAGGFLLRVVIVLSSEAV
ncbi:MAG TPA: NrfD/PsrC family molybdoenzyme membrane anchor subunit [Methylomirabilota bacterium]|jgi:formate-dependent nitrite reductase membrane component NrfD